MCSPAAWKERERSWGILWAAALLAEACLLALCLFTQACNYVLHAETAYVMNGTIPAYAPSKEYVSYEVLDEVLGVRPYITALAAYDLHHGGNQYATAAFDLDPVIRHAFGESLGAFLLGRRDWQANTNMPRRGKMHTTANFWD